MFCAPPLQNTHRRLLSVHRRLIYMNGLKRIERNVKELDDNDTYR